MAKYSPYFKFYVSEYNDGDIQLCTMEAQGLFMNLCSTYWSKEGELVLSKAKRLFKVREKVWQELIEERCIKVSEDKISISFLDEQLLEREELSKQNSKNVAKRYEKPNIEPTTVEIGITPTLQVEYNKEGEKSIEEKSISKEKEKREEARATLGDRNFEWFKNQIDEIWIDQLPSEKKSKLGAAIENAWAFLTTDGHRLKIIDSTGCKKLVNNAFEFVKTENNGTSKPQLKWKI